MIFIATVVIIVAAYLSYERTFRVPAKTVVENKKNADADDVKLTNKNAQSNASDIQEIQLTGPFYIGGRQYTLYFANVPIDNETHEEKYYLKYLNFGTNKDEEITLQSELLDSSTSGMCHVPPYNIFFSPSHQKMLLTSSCGDAPHWLLIGVEPMQGAKYDPSGKSEYKAFAPVNLDFGEDSTYYKHPLVVGFTDENQILVNQQNLDEKTGEIANTYYWTAPIENLNQKKVISGL